MQTPDGHARQPKYFKRLRWGRALRWVAAAEAAEGMVLIALSEEERQRYGKLAIQHYLRAMRWWPLAFPYHLPPPRNMGAHPADEQLYKVAMPSTVPCIWCGRDVERPRRGSTQQGLYCETCTELLGL